MNDLPVIGYPSYEQRTLGSSGGKYCYSLIIKEMYGEKLFPRPKKGILERDQHFFAVFLSQMDLGMLRCGKFKFLLE